MQHGNQGIDMETKKTSLVGNEVSIDMALERPAGHVIRGIDWCVNKILILF